MSIEGLDMEPTSNKSGFEARINNLASFIMAMIICSKMINAAVARVYSGTIQTGFITMSIIWGSLLVYYVLSKKRRANLRGAIFMVYILAFFAVSYFITNSHIQELTLHFLEYGVVGYLIAGTDFNFEKATRYSGYIVLILSIPTYQLIQSSYSTYSNVLGMNESYTILPPVFAVLTHCLYYRKKSDWIMYGAYIFGGYLLISMLLRGIRGAVLCIFVYILFAILNTIRFRGKLSVKRFSVIFAVLLFLINIDSIIELIVKNLPNTGINVRFLEKTIRLGTVASGDFSNGRVYLYSIAFEDFMKSPIWGNGIGFFPDAHNINYPHNMIFQVLSEGGILLGIPIISITIYCLYILVFGKIENRNLMIATIMLASSTIPAAFFTDELWHYQLLWVLFGVIIKKSNMLFIEERNQKDASE